jgi:hypothetical protein
MSSKRSFNPKRKLLPVAGREFVVLDSLSRKVEYRGNPQHKRNPGDYGLLPPAAARLHKTLCDSTGLRQQDALSLLREAVRRGMISEQFREDWPQNVWAVTGDGVPLEAQLEGNGVYHGYPMPESDPFRMTILEAWEQGE